MKLKVHGTKDEKSVIWRYGEISEEIQNDEWENCETKIVSKKKKEF